MKTRTISSTEPIGRKCAYDKEYNCTPKCIYYLTCISSPHKEEAINRGMGITCWRKWQKENNHKRLWEENNDKET